MIDRVDLKAFLKEIESLGRLRMKVKVDIIGTLGHIVVIANKIDLSRRILRINLNYGLVAQCGMISCLIQLYKRVNKQWV